MNIYAIYLNSSEDNQEIVTVKQGTSLTAVFFNIFWAAYYRMWSVVGGVFLLHLTFVLLEEYLRFPLIPVAQALTVAIFWFFAEDLRDYVLRKKKFTLQDIVIASSPLEAEIKYLTKRPTI